MNISEAEKIHDQLRALARRTSLDTERKLAQESAHFVRSLLAFACGCPWPAAQVQSRTKPVPDLVKRIKDRTTPIGDGFDSHDLRRFLLRWAFGFRWTPEELTEARKVLLDAVTPNGRIHTRAELETAYRALKRKDTSPSADTAYKICRQFKSARDRLDRSMHVYGKNIEVLVSQLRKPVDRNE